MLFSTNKISSSQGQKLKVLLESSIDDMKDESYSLAGLPRRISDADDHLVEERVDPRGYQVQLKKIDSPVELLFKKEKNANWLSTSANTRIRLYGAFLIAEDPQRRLEARKVATLMHQTSLVQHILQDSNLKKVLIGDEVGLGKTVEAGLLVRQLIDEDPRCRVLYLAPAQLVRNVHSEFRRLDIRSRSWTANGVNARELESEQIVIASIHRAVHQNHFKNFVGSTGTWDVLIVDECHHLTSYAGAGNRSYELVRSLIRKLRRDNGRVVLLSGTPHQGSQERFKSILELISDNEKYTDSVTKRVIFRTKDRVTDWKGKPLFPGRQVNEAIVIRMGEEYRKWYTDIGRLYTNGEGRAHGWAKGQALQWTASSIHAGLAFLTRLGMRRLNWDLEDDILREVLMALRPYRGGKKDERLEHLFDRIKQQIGDGNNIEDPDNPEIYNAPPANWKPNHDLLSQLIRDGILLASGDSIHAKWQAVFEIIDAADMQSEENGLPKEKFVLFAQPVETVIAAAEALKAHYPNEAEPVIIIGDQNHADRSSTVEKFWDDNGPRFLISSKAGGEGLNMQCARRLIHLDVPWNPMDMEQRVGRVHRFGSHKKIIVDTIITDGSREMNMYAAARARLRQVAIDMVKEEDFEMLFSRVMSLVPPDAFEGILDPAAEELDQQAIGQLIEAGYRSWSEFDQQYRTEANKIKELDPGYIEWEDLEKFIALEFKKSETQEEAEYQSFDYNEYKEEITATSQKVPVVWIEGKPFVCGDTGGLPAILKDGTRPEQIGLNSEYVQRALQKRFLDTEAAVAILRSSELLMKYFQSATPVLLLAFLRQELKYENNQWQEKNIELKIFPIFLQENHKPYQPLDRAKSAELVRAIQDIPRLASLNGVQVPPDLVEIEKEIWGQLRQTAERTTRYAVWPIAAIVLAA